MHLSVSVRSSSPSPPVCDPSIFVLNPYLLRFQDDNIESQYLETRKGHISQMCRLGVILLILGIVRLIPYGMNSPSSWIFILFLITIMCQIPNFIVSLFESASVKVLYWTMLFSYSWHCLACVSENTSLVLSQPLPSKILSISIILSFIWRVFHFRHATLLCFGQVLVYGCLLSAGKIEGYEKGSPGPLISLGYYLALAVIITVDGYIVEKKEREAFTLGLKMGYIVQAFASMDIEHWENIAYRKDASKPEQHLTNLMSKLKEFQAFLPQALVQKHRRNSMDFDALRSHSSVYQAPSFNRNMTGIPCEPSTLGEIPETPDRVLKTNTLLYGGFSVRDVSVLCIQLPFTLPQPPSIGKGVSRMDLVSLYSLHSEFLSIVLDSLERTGGVSLMLGGGYIIATWNAYSTRAQHCYFACRCALTIASKLDGQGVHQCVMAVTSGPCVVGSSGNVKVRTPVVLGGAVEFSVQLAMLNGTIGTRILISQDVYEAVEPSFVAEIVDYVVPCIPNGNSLGRVAAYELTGFKNPTRQNVSKLDLIFKQAFVELSCRRYAESEALFYEYLTQAERLTRRPSIVSNEGVGGGENVQPLNNSPSKIVYNPLPAPTDALPTKGNVRQAIRLYRLSVYFRRVQNTMIYTYRRRFGWHSYEDEAESIPLPNHLQNLETLPNKFGEPDDNIPTSSDAIFKNHTVKLREELARNLQPHRSEIFPYSPSGHLKGSENKDYHNYLARTLSSDLSPSTVIARNGELTLGISTPSPPATTAIIPKSQQGSKYISYLLRTGSSENINNNSLSLSCKIPGERRISISSARSSTPPAENNTPEAKPKITEILEKIDQDGKVPLNTSWTGKDNPIDLVETGGSLESVRTLPVAMKQFTDCDGKVWQFSDIKLGEGAFGKVYLGMSQLGQLVAVKRMTIDPKQQEEMLNEIRLLLKLRHDNIVAYLGSAVVSNNLVIVLEYVSGGSLAYILEHFGPLAPTSVAQYSRHILRGLKYLHSNGVVHRDVKPANLLLDESGRCKLADFGTADHLSNAKNSVKGTPMYMAPEAHKGRDCLPASDIWSFGLTVLQLLTGNLPWSTMNRNENFLVHRIMCEDIVPDIPGHLPSMAQDFLKACIQRDPSARPSANQLMDMPFLL